MFFSRLVWFAFCFVFVCSRRTIEVKHRPSIIRCEYPRLDLDALTNDVLGGREKRTLCSLPTPASLCQQGLGTTDEACQKIARALGEYRLASCYRINVCMIRMSHGPQVQSETEAMSPTYIRQNKERRTNDKAEKTQRKRKKIPHKKNKGKRSVNTNTTNVRYEAYISLCVPDFAGVIFACESNSLVVIDPFFERSGSRDQDPKDTPTWAPLDVTRCGETDDTIEDFNLGPKITQGRNIKRGQIPWQVALYKNHKDNEEFSHFCGASIITPQHLLTAAHCFSSFALESFTYKAVIGEYDLTKTELFEQDFYFQYQKVYLHENYNDISKENDIAIIKLDGTILFNKYAQPICLPARTLEYKDSLNCVVSGWGQMSKEKLAHSRTLLATRLPLLNREECGREEAYGALIKEGMFCAGSFLGGADSCQGDSGGPIVCKFVDHYHKQYMIQYGIVSFGEGCGQVGKPGVYTKVAQYQQWIDSTIHNSIYDISRVVIPKTKKVVPISQI